MGSCQNYGPCLGTLNIRCRIILRTQEGTVILTTTEVCKTQAKIIGASVLEGTGDLVSWL